MKLYATPRSHFSRKVRILLELYSIPYEFIDVGNVADSDLETFGKNPLMKVPALIDGENWIIESDHIANYIVNKFDPVDKYQVKIESVADLNIRAVLNGTMTEEVKIILGKRTSIPINEFSFFDKALASIGNGLDWLDLNFPKVDVECLKYRDIHLVCLCEHLEFYKVISLDRYSNLRKAILQLSDLSEIKKTSPYSL
ncbi:glutathione S-transferase [Halobacteriovorax marinus]|uniref:glutathione S-transferase n=1 Tax=Halobacteriovorax marinus TaxID=97084 RepID=UPI003A92230A